MTWCGARTARFVRGFPDGMVWVAIGERADLVTVQRQLAGHLDLELESSTTSRCIQE
jgi:hypothetical protein